VKKFLIAALAVSAAAVLAAPARRYLNDDAGRKKFVYRRNADRTGRFFAVMREAYYKTRDLEAAAARYDLVVLDPVCYPTPPPELKEEYPRLKVLGYLNVFCFLDTTDVEPNPLRPEPKKPDQVLERRKALWKEAMLKRYLYYDAHNKPVRVSMNSASNLYGLDRGKPEVRAFLARRAKEIVDGGYDGVFIDGLEVRYPFGYGLGRWVSAEPVLLDADRWREHTRELMNAIVKEAGPGKITVAGEIRDRFPKLSAEFVEPLGGGFDLGWLRDGKFAPHQWERGD